MAERLSDNLKQQFRWLADAPLFTDADQINRIHDAIVQPEKLERATTIEVTTEVAGEIGSQIGLSAEIEPNALIKAMSTYLPFLNFKGRVDAGLEGKVTGSGGKTETIEFYPITSPERQLIHLTLHYLSQLPSRVKFVDDIVTGGWRRPEFIADSPRALVFLDIHSGVKIIPTAAEFQNGAIELLYREFEDPIKAQLGDRFLAYPAEPTPDALKKYWLQFKDKFSANKCMEAVENASKLHAGGIRWIDYRVLLTEAGDTLHLHVNAAGKYDTGVFAYNFVKRSYKHGVRVVGMLKSEPDLNVLAIYDK